jgi:hypothetical protein
MFQTHCALTPQTVPNSFGGKLRESLSKNISLLELLSWRKNFFASLP